MKLEQSFEVSAPLERVWAALIDVERVAPCLPGAAVTGRNEDGSFNGTFSVKIGPTSASYAGRLAMQDIDEAAHRATMQAHGTDKRGQGGADATIVSSLRALDDGRTQVEVSTDYRITGRLARFGRGGMIEDISEKLLRQFASSLQESLQSPSEPVVDGALEGVAAAGPAGPNGTTEAAAQAAETSAPSAAPDAPDVTAAPASATPPQSSEISGLSLIGSVLLTRLRRNPAPVLGGLVGLLVLLRLRRR